MKIDLSELKHVPELNIVYEEEDKTRAISQSTGIDSRKPLSTSLKILLVDKDVLIEGKVRGSYELVCSRCLINFDYYLTTMFNTEIPLSQIDNQNWQWDPSEEIRQVVVLALPVKPLCKDDCNGLCMQCGTNLNQEKCNCNEKIYDKQWSKLKLLMEKKNAKS